MNTFIFDILVPSLAKVPQGTKILKKAILLELLHLEEFFTCWNQCYLGCDLMIQVDGVDSLLFEGILRG